MVCSASNISREVSAAATSAARGSRVAIRFAIQRTARQFAVLTCVSGTPAMLLAVVLGGVGWTTQVHAAACSASASAVVSRSTGGTCPLSVSLNQVLTLQYRVKNASIVDDPASADDGSPVSAVITAGSVLAATLAQQTAGVGGTALPGTLAFVPVCAVGSTGGSLAAGDPCDPASSQCGTGACGCLTSQPGVTCAANHLDPNKVSVTVGSDVEFLPGQTLALATIRVAQELLVPLPAICGEYFTRLDSMGDVLSTNDPLCTNTGSAGARASANLYAPAPPCGDGVVDAGEACDDGNLVDGDGCDSNCTLTACGNGIVTAGEVCDDGNLTDGDGCDANCTLTACGNGIVTAGETCDDGNATDGDGCDSNCTLTACGNGIVTAGETCDDGNLVNGDGCNANCVANGCGDGVVGPGEECDPPDAEICNNGIDDDGDNQIDCADPDCAQRITPGCNATCRSTPSCTPILKDPAIIVARAPLASGRHDFVRIHGRFDAYTAIDPTADGFVFALSNESGEIFRARLLPGDLQLRGTRRWRFIDKTAKTGPGIRDGFFKVKVDRTGRGPLYNWVFSFSAYGDLSGATVPTMTTQTYLGDDVAVLKATWSGSPGNWRLTLKDAYGTP